MIREMGNKTTPLVPEPFRGLLHLYEEARRAVAERADLSREDFEAAGGMMILAPLQCPDAEYAEWCRRRVASIGFLVGEVFGEYSVVVARRVGEPEEGSQGVVLDYGHRKVIEVVPVLKIYGTRAEAEARVRELTAAREELA